MREPRPFYLVGHDTNSLEQIRAGLSGGLNAFEIDVNEDHEGQLYVSHAPVNAVTELFAAPAPAPLRPFLDELAGLASSPEGAGIALVIFDCKVSRGEQAVELVAAVREHLLVRNPSLPVIFSVPSLNAAHTFFEPIHARLGAREALMVDEEDEPHAVAEFLAGKGVARAAYGNGITTAIGVGLPTPRLIAQMDRAVALMELGSLRFVYPWVLVAASTIRGFVRTGVSGVMVEIEDAGTLAGVLAEPEFSPEIRPAVRDDDPLARRASLVLEVRTADALYAGTNTVVTFELTGPRGQRVSRSVDSAFTGRFERGTLTYVTFPGVALRPEQVSRISVSHDGRGLAPGWKLESVALRSRDGEARLVEFDCVIESDRPVVRAV